MRKIIPPVIPNINHHYQPQRTNNNFIIDNIKIINSNNNNMKINESSNKKHYKFNVDIPYLASKEKKSNPVIDKKVPVEPVSRSKLEDIKSINYFVRRIKEENIHYISGNKKGIIYRGDLNIANKGKPTTLSLDGFNYLGHGTYGTAYRVGNFVIKVPFYNTYKINPQSNVHRCSNLLNELNKNPNFSRAITLDNGNDILITKYISGKNVEDDEAYDFVKQRGRVIFDYGSEGNVKIDNNGKKYIIDADLIAQPIELKRYPSLGTLTIRKIYKKNFIKAPLETNEVEPRYYHEIKDLLPK